MCGGYELFSIANGKLVDVSNPAYIGGLSGLTNPPTAEAMKKLKSIEDTTQESKIRRLGRAVYPR
jgi:hypothetical protein